MTWRASIKSAMHTVRFTEWVSVEDCIVTLGQFDEADGRRIQELLKIIVGGQIFDLQRFPGETENELVALSNDEELDHYTYMVAGCVGEFWTKESFDQELPKLGVIDWRKLP